MQSQSGTAVNMSDTDLLDKFNLLDRAAKKSDRWWFFALLVLGMVFIGYILNWGKAELNKRDARIASLEERYSNHMYAQAAQSLAQNVQMSAALAENTKVIETNNRLLESLIRKP